MTGVAWLYIRGNERQVALKPNAALRRAGFEQQTLYPAAALEAQGRALAEAGWRPIETAPKDGTPVLMTAFGGQIAVCAWCDGWLYHGLPTTPVDWWDEPSHWQPLPEPPVSSGQNLADANPNQSPSSQDQEIAGLSPLDGEA